MGSTHRTERKVSLRIMLLAPPPDVDFGVQEGKGASYKTIQTQRSNGADLHFNVEVAVKDNREDGLPNFMGLFSQGPATGRFIYLDVGTCAGQTNTPWSRRIKVPLGGIGWDMIEAAAKDPMQVVEARLPGTGKDGGPSCATQHPIGGWKLRR